MTAFDEVIEFKFQIKEIFILSTVTQKFELKAFRLGSFY